MDAEEIANIAVLAVPMVVAVSSALATQLKDSRLGWLAKLINLLALNVGRASNDPGKN